MWLTFFLAYFLAFYLAHLLTFHIWHAFWHSIWHLSLSIPLTFYSDTLSTSFWHSIRHSFRHSFCLSGILFGNFCGILSGIRFGILAAGSHHLATVGSSQIRNGHINKRWFEWRSDIDSEEHVESQLQFHWKFTKPCEAYALFASALQNKSTYIVLIPSAQSKSQFWPLHRQCLRFLRQSLSTQLAQSVRSLAT